MFSIDGPNIFQSGVVNIAPGKDQKFFLLCNLILKHLHYLNTVLEENEHWISY